MSNQSAQSPFEDDSNMSLRLERILEEAALWMAIITMLGFAVITVVILSLIATQAQ